MGYPMGFSSRLLLAREDELLGLVGLESRMGLIPHYYFFSINRRVAGENSRSSKFSKMNFL